MNANHLSISSNSIDDDMVRTTVGQILGYDGTGLIDKQPILDAIIAEHYLLKADNGTIMASKRYDEHHEAQLQILVTPDGNIHTTTDLFFRIYYISREAKPNNGGPFVDHELNKIRKSMNKYYRAHTSKN